MSSRPPLDASSPALRRTISEMSLRRGLFSPDSLTSTISERIPPSTAAGLTEAAHKLSHELYSIWLFTFSDIKTIVAPSLLFALFTAPALSVFGIHSPLSSSTAADYLQRIPLVVLWLWINLLPFNIDNQRQPDSIAEDALNKPWRTLPSGRMSPRRARALMLFLYPAALLVSLRVGGTEHCLSLMALGFWYNDMRGADGSCVVRNLINAFGFNRFTTGALEVLMLTHPGARAARGPLLMWQAIVAAIVFTTVQAQDMYDQVGDAERDRKTVPLVIGDAWGRWSIAVPVMAWSVLCPAYVGAPPAGWLVCGGLGLLVAGRTLAMRSVKADRRTFLLWNIWLVSVYSLPLWRAMRESSNSVTSRAMMV